MIVRIFPFGKGQGNPIVDYLYNEEKHESYKPETVSGNPDLTKNIINTITNKHKYVAGVIAFRDDEKLTNKQQLDLINSFQKTFAPFDKQDRVNFLWVRHMDKGNLELHFVMPRVDLKTQKAFNLHPPGKANELFFQSFTRIQNMKYGFRQVDDLQLSKQQIDKTFNVFDDLKSKRKEYLSKTFDKPRKVRNIKYYGTTKNKRTPRQLDTKSRKLSTSTKSTVAVDASSTTRSHEKSVDFSTSVNISTVCNQQAQHQSQSYADATRQFLEQSTEFRKSAPRQQATVSHALSVEEQIRALSLSLNTCDPSQALGIYTQLGALQAQLAQQALRPKYK